MARKTSRHVWKGKEKLRGNSNNANNNANTSAVTIGAGACDEGCAEHCDSGAALTAVRTECHTHTCRGGRKRERGGRKKGETERRRGESCVPVWMCFRHSLPSLTHAQNASVPTMQPTHRAQTAPSHTHSAAHAAHTTVLHCCQCCVALTAALGLSGTPSHRTDPRFRHSPPFPHAAHR